MGYQCNGNDCKRYFEAMPVGGFCVCGRRNDFSECEAPPEPLPVVEDDRDQVPNECEDAATLYINGLECCRPQSGVPLTLGRDSENEIVKSMIKAQTVSRRHAELTLLENNMVSVRDLGSTSGTLVNGKPIGPYAETFPLPIRIFLGRTGVAIVEVKK
jgi:hypothetical protein